MKCPRCGEDGAVKNGGNRTYCRKCGKYGAIPAKEQDDPTLAAKAGWSPEHQMVHPAAPGFQVKGTSTLYRENGTVAVQWVKTAQDAEAMQAAIEAMIVGLSDKLPREKPRRAPAKTASDLANVYVLTDFHLGMLAWGEETGADWDIKIAEDMLVAWFSAAIAQAPDAEVGVFAELGDFGHWDGLESVTPTSGHSLDADSRFQKLVRVTIRAVRRIIGMLLEKHDRVHVLTAEGNHNLASSAWMREWLAAVYENEPRITVDTSPDPYYCYEHGETALFFHHGHKRRMGQIDTVFAAKFREVFGRTKHAYAHMGHLHHIDVKETNLMVIEQHRTLAAPDAHASRGGWVSGRDACVITYSKRFGEVGRVRISASMLETGGP